MLNGFSVRGQNDGENSFVDGRRRRRWRNGSFEPCRRADARAAPPGHGPADGGVEQVLQLKESRYQIGQIERLLEGAFDNRPSGRRSQAAIMPADMLLTENARARGFRLDGYGVFFDVEVPNLEGTLPWSFRTLDQNDLGVGNALQTLRSYIQTSATNDVALRQALERIELQLTPGPGTVNVAAPAAATPRTVSTQSAPAAVQPPQVAKIRFWRTRTRPIERLFATHWSKRCSNTREASTLLPTSGSRLPPAAATIVPDWHPPTPRVRRTFSASAAPTWRLFLPVRSRLKKP